MVRKTEGSVRALLLAAFANVWSDALYPHLYCARGAFGEPCDGVRLQRGAGDKVAAHAAPSFTAPPGLRAVITARLRCHGRVADVDSESPPPPPHHHLPRLTPPQDTFMLAWHMLDVPYEFMPLPSFFALNLK